VHRRDPDGIIRGNYDLYSAIASASHNRCIERGFQQMLADKLRLAQHGIAGTSHGKGHALADRFSGTARILKKLVAGISSGDLQKTDAISRELNAYIRRQVMETFEASLATKINVPPVAADESKTAPIHLRKVRRMLVAAAGRTKPARKLVVMKTVGKDSAVRLYK